MERRRYPKLDETVFWNRLPNGLTVAVVPRPGFSRKMAYFVTGAGAMHRRFTMDGQDYCMPMGIAHYLEHKLFDMPGDRDISAEFAALGASVNAFTSYDMTAYYFSCTDNLAECLRLLLSFVSTPYFTEKSVAKEQEIIGQEIDMNEDAPDNQVFENLAECMYWVHPIREPILGTRQTIGEITPQTLYDFHRACYRPENMLLCVVADADPEEISALAWEMTKTMPCPRVELEESWEEPNLCRKDYVSGRMEIARPMFQLGFKCQSLGTGETAAFREFVGDLAAEVLFGGSSELYSRMYEQGLIDPSFGGGLDTLSGMAMLSVSGDSDDPETVRDAILQQAEKIVREGIPDFLRIKRSTLGERIRSLDSFDSVCFRICAYYFTGFDYFTFPAVYERIQARDVQNFIAETVTPQRCCLSVIIPKEEKA